METQVVENKQNSSSQNSEDISRANVDLLSSRVKLVDVDEDIGLSLYCYAYCTNEDNDMIKQCRGLVYHGDNLIMKAFSYTPEYTCSDIKILEKELANFNKWSFYEACEGALLRLFFFENRWHLTTHRKLNAFRSKWSSPDSFGTIFKAALDSEYENNLSFQKRLNKFPFNGNILDRFQSSLDTSKQYMFLLRNTKDNRIVCNPPSRPTVYHVGTFNSDHTLVLPYSTEETGLQFPKKLSFRDVKHLLDYVENKIDPWETQGIVCFGPSPDNLNNKQIKVLNSVYQNMFRVRGNEPSVKFRYLQVRMDRKMVDSLYSLYPEHSKHFEDYENILYDIAKFIYQSYKDRFIVRKNVTVPREEYQVMKECHSWHLQDKTKNRVDLERVIRILNNQSPTNLNHMIRRFIPEKAKKEQMKPRMYKSSATNSPNLNATTSSPSLTPLMLKKLPPPNLTL